MNEVVVVKTGTANTASVLAALRRVGCEARLSSEAADVAAASAAVLPGVGSFGAAMGEIERHGLVDVLRERVVAGRPTLCICLGLQVLARSSEESPTVPGLGVIDARVTKFGGGVRVPHMGWNQVHLQSSNDAKKQTRKAGALESSAACLNDGFAYFANSYKLDDVPEGWEGAVSVHGAPFVSAISRMGVLACQFHPELSGKWGLGLIRGWLERASGAGGAAC